MGAVPIDREILAALDARLKKELGFGLTPVAHDPEHSLEIELPFLQRALGGEFRLVPVMVRDQSRKTIQALGLALGESLRGREFLMVASTDLSHFYPQDAAEKLDAALLSRVEAFDPAGVLQVEQEGAASPAGAARWLPCFGRRRSWAPTQPGCSITLLQPRSPVTSPGWSVTPPQS